MMTYAATRRVDGEARARSIPTAVCKRASNEASNPASHSPEGRGGGQASASLPLLDDALGHRLRRGASHLPARRSRHMSLYLWEGTLNLCFRILRARSVVTRC